MGMKQKFQTNTAILSGQFSDNSVQKNALQVGNCKAFFIIAQTIYFFK